jgi:hypothetical protein
LLAFLAIVFHIPLFVHKTPEFIFYLSDFMADLIYALYMSLSSAVDVIDSVLIHLINLASSCVALDAGLVPLSLRS